MLERLLIVAIITLIGVIAYQVYTRRHLVTVSANSSSDPILSGLNPTVPTIVYFTTPMCVPCKTQQQPAIKSLCEKREIQVIQIDATQSPDVAQRWGVMSVPTTFILDDNLQATSVNHGVANETKLRKQVNQAMRIA